MFPEPGTPHHLPHFHAYYQDEVAVVGLDPVEILAGHLPQKQQRLVEAWAELRKSELLTDWALLHSGHAAAPIDPLK
jgi:hypothetical protein